MIHRHSYALTLLLAVAMACAAPARAMKLEDLGGHMGLGYSKLMLSGAPGGSLAFSGGLDYPISHTLRAGADVGYQLLGSNTEEEGSLSAEIDYSLFEADALLHWTPSWAGPVGRISFGPALFNPRADVTSSASVGFSEFARDDWVVGGALGMALLSRKPAPVRAGFEVAVRIAPLPEETWTVLTARLVILY